MSLGVDYRPYLLNRKSSVRALGWGIANLEPQILDWQRIVWEDSMPPQWFMSIYRLITEHLLLHSGDSYPFRVYARSQWLFAQCLGPWIISILANLNGTNIIWWWRTQSGEPWKEISLHGFCTQRKKELLSRSSSADLRTLNFVPRWSCWSLLLKPWSRRPLASVACFSKFFAKKGRYRNDWGDTTAEKRSRISH